MNNANKHAFHWRGFIATTAGLSFLGLSITGMVMFVVPPGRIANWNGWVLGGLSKQQWSGLHIWLGVVFIGTAAVHLYFNWRVFVSYFKNKLTRHFALRTEWLASLLLCGFVVTGAITGLKPFSVLTDWKESLKHSWDAGWRGGPVARADTLPIQERAGRGMGIGRMTLKQYCDEFGLELDDVVSALERSGVKATRRMTIREIADATGLHPSEIRQYLE